MSDLAGPSLPAPTRKRKGTLRRSCEVKPLGAPADGHAHGIGRRSSAPPGQGRGPRCRRPRRSAAASSPLASRSARRRPPLAVAGRCEHRQPGSESSATTSSSGRRRRRSAGGRCCRRWRARTCRSTDRRCRPSATTASAPAASAAPDHGAGVAGVRERRPAPRSAAAAGRLHRARPASAARWMASSDRDQALRGDRLATARPGRGRSRPAPEGVPRRAAAARSPSRSARRRSSTNSSVTRVGGAAPEPPPGSLDEETARLVPSRPSRAGDGRR